MRIFAHREQTDNQTNREQSLNSKTEATLILCGSSGERANNLPNSLCDALLLAI